MQSAGSFSRFSPSELSPIRESLQKGILLLCQRFFHPSIFPFMSFIVYVESSTVRAISLSLLFLLPLFYDNPIWSDSSLSTLLLVRLVCVNSREQQTRIIFGKVMLHFFSLASIMYYDGKQNLFSRLCFFPRAISHTKFSAKLFNCLRGPPVTDIYLFACSPFPIFPCLVVFIHLSRLFTLGALESCTTAFK